MESSEIDLFLKLVEGKSISKAAEKLYLAQSTVSKRLQSLENDLGYRLFERNKGIKTLELTPQGEKFVIIAERWKELLSEAQHIGLNKYHHRINIGTVPSANMTFMPQLCRRLWAYHNHFFTRVISLHSWDMYDEIDKRNIDIGFTVLEQSHNNVITTPCFSVPLVGICVKGSKIKKKMHVQTLNPNFCINIFWGTSYQSWFDYWFHSMESPQLTIDNPYILFSALEHKEQWSIVPQAIANLMLETNRFSTFKIYPAPPDRVFYKVMHKAPKSHLVPILDTFNHCLNEELKSTYKNVYEEYKSKR